MATTATEQPELVMARGATGDDGSVTFAMIFAGDPEMAPGEADLTMRTETWEAMGRPDTVHVYNAD